MTNSESNYVSDMQRFFRIPLHPGSFAATQWILSQVPIQKDTVICDLGCGRGMTLEYIHSNYGCKCFGVDKSFSVLKSIKDIRVNLINSSVKHLPFNDVSIDFVLVESVLIHTDVGTILSEVSRVVKPGGYVAINDSFLRTSVDVISAQLLFNTLEHQTKVPLHIPFTVNKTLEYFSKYGFKHQTIDDTPKYSYEPLLHRLYRKYLDWKYSINNHYHDLNLYLENKILIARKEY